jgi:hypothetical protein
MTASMRALATVPAEHHHNGARALYFTPAVLSSGHSIAHHAMLIRVQQAVVHRDVVGLRARADRYAHDTGWAFARVGIALAAEAMPRS